MRPLRKLWLHDMAKYHHIKFSSNMIIFSKDYKIFLLIRFSFINVLKSNKQSEITFWILVFKNKKSIKYLCEEIKKNVWKISKLQ